MNKNFTFLNQFKIRIEDKRIHVRLGYKVKTSEINSSVKKYIQEFKADLAEMIEPRAVYTILDYKQTNKHPVFKGAEKIAFCICTIGPELEKRSAQLMDKGEILKGYILDAFGSEAAEETARQSDRIIAQKARDMNLWPSKRFSPGYGVWELKEQKYLFDVLPSDKIGVHLTDTYMMIPRKSVSYRINFYKNKESSTRRF
ncbi:MAG TPA: vitamin B12 dependent-methionine synthase activation domain-containing protein [Acidobacteriota bacterium]|nr:vitamin B12 dependent-methionine synthase activation domain-containing protein [Acidobacteriota bacterium]